MSAAGIIALVIFATGLLGIVIMDAARLIAKSIDKLADAIDDQVSAQKAFHTELRSYGRTLERWRRFNMGEPEPKGLGDVLAEFVATAKQEPDGGPPSGDDEAI